MKRLIGILVLAAAVEVSASGFPSLMMGADARFAALGNAGTAWPGDGSAGFRNPALTAEGTRGSAVFSAHRWMRDVQSGFLGFTAPGGKTGFGGHILVTDIPGIEHRTGPSETPLGTFSASEITAGLDIGRKLTPAWSVGLGGRVYYQKILVDEAFGAGADLGVCYAFSRVPVRVAAAAQNIGTVSRLADERIRLPLTFRIGAAVQLAETAGGDWLVLADAVKERDSDLGLAAGVEYGWKGVLFLRSGYRSGLSALGPSGGVGVSAGRLRFDYAFLPLKKGLGDSHRLTVAWSF
ncbi:MAG: PorV/PorQ family protein [bacterium]|nr:PorV/PorQ family protein [bacterium]